LRKGVKSSGVRAEPQGATDALGTYSVIEESGPQLVTKTRWISECFYSIGFIKHSLKKERERERSLSSREILCSKFVVEINEEFPDLKTKAQSPSLTTHRHL
jgi:hypothetical protein